MACKVKVTAGPVEVLLSHADHAGPCPLYKRAERLLLAAAGIVAVVGAGEAEADTEPQAAPMGFTAHLERAPDFIDRDLSDYFEESP